MKNIIIIAVLLSVSPLLTNASSQSIKLVSIISANTGNVNSFKDCVDQNYPIMQTFPETCRTNDGRIFTKNYSSDESSEVMDGIGRDKDRLLEQKNKTNGTSATQINATNASPISKEILEAIREGKRGEELINVIRGEFLKLKDKTLSLDKDIKTSQEKLKKSLQSKIKDQKKVEIALRISGNFNNLNQKMTDKYSDTLDKIESILNEISTKTDSLEKSGRDVSRLRKLIMEERELIEISRLAVKTQALKIYNVNVGSDTSLKNDFGLVRQNLQADLEKIKEEIKTAHLWLKDIANLLSM